MNFSDFLRFLVSDPSYKGWEQSATDWFSLIIVIVVVITIVMTLIKLAIKASAAHAVDKIWTRARTWGFVFLGFLPISVVLSFFWYTNLDIYKVANMGGLVKGILLAWAIYFVFFLLPHLVIRSWRNEL